MRIGLIGSGSWGTALAKILTDNGHDLLWCVRSEKIADHIRQRHHNPKYLSSIYFGQEHLRVTTDPSILYKEADTVVLAVPSAYVEASIVPHLPQASEHLVVVSAVKGMVPGRHLLVNEYLEKEFHFDSRRYVTVMGPCHAEEVAAEKLSYLTFAAKEETLGARVAGLFKTPYINTVVSQDVAGVQYAAILKNVYALGAGIAHGIGYGDNFLSVFIANAAGELKRFLEAVRSAGTTAVKSGKIDHATSVYLGDLLVTCYSLFSRNRAFGNLIGKGYSIASALQDMQMVAEGYPASKSIHAISAGVGVSMPILESVHEILWHQGDAVSRFQQLESFLR